MWKSKHMTCKQTPYNQSYGFLVVMYRYELDHKQGWALKNWCFQTIVLEKTLESPLDSKEIKPVHPKGNQSWIFIGRTDAEAEAPILWPPDARSWLIGKDPDAGKDWRQKEKVTTEDEMVGWHHWLNGHEFEETPGGSEGPGSLVCCSPWVHKESWLSDWTELNWTTAPSTISPYWVEETGAKDLEMILLSEVSQTELSCGALNGKPWKKKG